MAPLVEVPTRRYRESWEDYVDRTQVWDQEFTEAAEAKGGSVFVPYPHRLNDVASTLFVKLCWYCWIDEIEQFAPIYLSAQQAAALLGFTDINGQMRAQSAIDELVATGFLSVEKPAIEHRRGALLGLFCPDPADAISVGV